MEVLLENSKSKSGKHMLRSLIFKVINGDISQVDLPGKKVTPTYKIGEARVVNIPSNGIYVYIYLLRNLKGRVTGKVIVFDSGRPVLVMKYRKLKLKLIDGEEKYSIHVKKVFEKLKIPVKKINVKKVI